MPDEAALAAAMAIENVKVEKLVREFLIAQSLKILPRTQFGVAVTEYVDKDDKRAMETFVDESLAEQVKQMLSLEGEELDIDTTMDEIRARQEELWAAGAIKDAKKGRKLNPKPDTWDSDDMGHWADDPASHVFGADDSEAAGSKRGRGFASIFSDDDDASVISQTKNKGPAKKAPAKKAPAKPRAPAKSKAPAKAPARGRKKVVEISDDEEDDVIMQDDTPPPAKSQPKRAAAAAAKGRQSTLTFAPSQANKTQAIRELSEDEISEDDAFEPMASSSRRR
jgi:double-strand break repair protein MRE11